MTLKVWQFSLRDAVFVMLVVAMFFVGRSSIHTTEPPDDSPPPKRFAVVVAARDIQEGVILTKEDMEVVEWELPPPFGIKSVDSAVGKKTIQNIEKGSYLGQDMLELAPE